MSAEKTNTDQIAIAKIAKLSFRNAFVAGIFSILVGILALLWPVATVIVIAILFGTYLCITGITSIVEGFASGIPQGMRWIYVINGALSLLLAGLCIYSGLGSTITLLGIWIGISWVVRGCAVALTAFLDKSTPARISRIVLGIFSVICGTIILAWPGLSLVVLAQYIGAILFFLGVLEIVTAFQIRRDIQQLAD